jgi:hypothetical protein
MSGVFSMASHWVLQYFSLVMHEQFGCAHFLGSDIRFSCRQWFWLGWKKLMLGNGIRPYPE